MSGYARQIAVGAVLAIAVAVGLGIGAGYYFPGPAAPQMTTQTATSTGTAAQTTSTTSSSPVSTAVTQVTTATVTSSATTSVSSITAISTTTLSSTSSVTSPCSAPGVQCGSFQIVSLGLRVAGQPGSSNLTLTLKNTGNVNIGSFEVFIDYNVNASQLVGAVLPPGAQSTFSIPIPNANFPVIAGGTYSVSVEGFIIDSGHITANLWQSQSVVAQP